MERPPINVTGRNRLLHVLGPEGEALAARMERIEAEVGHFISRRFDPITHVQFPLNGMVSMVLGAEGGTSVEIGTIGNEGMVGTATYLHADRAPADTFFETSGSYLRMPVAEFRNAISKSPLLDALVGRYTQTMMNQMAQSVMCGALHTLEERLSRWLLMTHDRLEGDELDLTQEFIAQMLGARRPSVTVVAGTLQRAGLIRYHRGRVTVLDRAGLEESACECYWIVRKELDRLLGAEAAALSGTRHR